LSRADSTIEGWRAISGASSLGTRIAAAVLTMQHLGLALRFFLVAFALAPMSSLAHASYDIHFSTYFGGSGAEDARAVAVDDAGYIYIAGGTTSTDYPTTPGAYQRTFRTGGTSVGSRGSMSAFVTKFDPDGSLVWSTFIGGPNYDRIYSIRVDSGGYVYVSGRAGQGFPTTSGVLQPTFAGDTSLGAYGHQDGFVAKLSPDGSTLVWSTYFGDGSSAINRDMDIDSSGNVYVCSNNQSILSPHTTSGAYQTSYGGGVKDAFVAKIAADGSRVIWGTHFGGSGDEGCTSLRVDATGGVVIAGSTNSARTPTTAGAFDTTYGGNNDGYVARFSPDGASLVYATFLGGSQSDGVAGKHGLAVDAAGNAYAFGFTNSTDFPVTAGSLQSTNHGGFSGTWEQTGDRWIAKLSPDGRTLSSATFLGGNQRDGGEGIAVDGAGRILLGGFTYSSDFPVTTDAYQGAKGATRDGTLIVVSSDLARLEYASFLGGSDLDGFRAAEVAPDGSLVVVGNAASTNFPTVSPYQGSTNGGGDAVIVRLMPTSTTMPDGGVSTPDGGPATDSGSSCTPDCGGRTCGDDGCGGSCGSCATDRVCGSGVCLCDAALTDCGGSCVDTRSDPNHCGACGASCGGGESCTASACSAAPPDAGCTPDCTGRSCGGDGCGGSCGACGPAQLCANGGQCVCSDSMDACAGACVDLRIDPDHCGACDVVCAPGRACVGGACQGSPAPSPDGGAAGPEPDASMPGGCGCEVATSSPRVPSWSLVVFVFLLAVRVRHRRRR
jgi:hypothetical protein